MPEHVAELRRAVAELLECATVRDAAVAGLLDAIADAIDEAAKLGAPDPTAGPVVERAMHVARCSGVVAGIDWHRHSPEVPP